MKRAADSSLEAASSEPEPEGPRTKRKVFLKVSSARTWTVKPELASLLFDSRERTTDLLSLKQIVTMLRGRGLIDFRTPINVTVTDLSSNSQSIETYRGIEVVDFKMLVRHHLGIPMYRQMLFPSSLKPHIKVLTEKETGYLLESAELTEDCELTVITIDERF